jgi:CubicO group peptidase (beta-lactamase class C family)
VPWLARSLVAVGPADALTRTGREDRRDPRITSIWRDVEALYATGLHPAIALHIVHKGRVVCDRTIGHLDNVPADKGGRIASPDSLFSLFSGSKIVTAALVHALTDDGLIDLDRPVAHYLPAFAARGKEGIRLHHLLSHTAGIPDMPPEIDAPACLRAGKVPLEPILALRPQTPPGARVAYHPMTAWFLLQEILEQVTGTPLRALLRRRLLDPLRFATLDYGVPADRIPEVALHAITGPPAPALMADIFRRSIGADLDTAVRMSNEPSFLCATLPSANVIGTPREVSRFLYMLLRGGELDGVRVMSEAAVRRMTTVATPRQFDATFGFPMRYGLGVMMGGRRFSLFGLGTTGAFGHLGLSNVVVYACPARQLVVSFLNTGKPMLDPGMLRWYGVLQRIAASYLPG